MIGLLGHLSLQYAVSMRFRIGDRTPNPDAMLSIPPCQSMRPTTEFEGYQKMFDPSFSKFEDLGDTLRFPLSVVVRKPMNMHGICHLYKIEPDLLERLIKFTIEPLKPSLHSRYIFKLDDYLSSFLQDRDRSQLYHCDPKFQHISICRHFLSVLDGTDDFDHQS